MITDISNTVVILAGTSEYEYEHGIENLPQVESCLKKFFALFTDPKISNIDPDNIYFILNQSRTKFLETLLNIEEKYNSDANQKFPKRLLFYYCGHGIYDAIDAKSLIFILKDSNKKNLSFTGFPFSSLLTQLGKWVNVPDKILIIDTCYSAGVQGDYHALSGTLANKEDDMDADFSSDSLREYAILFPVSKIRGEEGIAKSVHPDPNYKKFTLFSGEIIRVLMSGISNVGDCFTIAEMIDEIRRAISIYDRNFPLPDNKKFPIPFYQTNARRINFAINKSNDNNSELGLIGLYDGDEDTNFKHCIKKAIEQSIDQMVFIGWGLAFIGNANRHLVALIQKHLNSNPELKMYILMVNPNHEGLKARIREEDQEQRNDHIFERWPDSFYNFIKKELWQHNQKNCFLGRINYMPTATILKMDQQFFYRPYGPPNRGGWQSPWLHIDATKSNPFWLVHLENEVDFAIQNFESE